MGNELSACWVIFSFSFLVALSGAMSPGPLLTYTIIKSASATQRGYLTGLWVIIGHALLEMTVIILMLLGFSFILKNQIIVRGIGIIGGLILIFFGISVIRDVCLKKISADFSKCAENTGQRTDNLIFGGAAVSMSNPYWWIWWATIGLAFMIKFDISFASWTKLLAFFLGHEAGDLVWYLLISILSFFGLRKLNPKVYSGILLCCGVFMAAFGLYLGISPFFQKL
jgi:threonine/homoserine/homoserine lactone efflux protein